MNSFLIHHHNEHSFQYLFIMCMYILCYYIMLCNCLLCLLYYSCPWCSQQIPVRSINVSYLILLSYYLAHYKYYAQHTASWHVEWICHMYYYELSICCVTSVWTLAIKKYVNKICNVYYLSLYSVTSVWTLAIGRCVKALIIIIILIIIIVRSY